jgi:hypothetical protein
MPFRQLLECFQQWMCAPSGNTEHKRFVSFAVVGSAVFMLELITDKQARTLKAAVYPGHARLGEVRPLAVYDPQNHTGWAWSVDSDESLYSLLFRI